VKRILVIGIILSLVLGILNTSAIGLRKGMDSVILMEENALISGFETSGFSFMEANINSILYLDNTFFEMKEMETIQREILKEFQLKGQEVVTENQEYFEPFYSENELLDDVIYIQKNTDIGYNQITARGTNDAGEIIVAIVYSIILEGEKESHIIIDIVKNKGYKDIVEYNYQNKAILGKYGNDIESTIGIVGYKAGKLSKIETQKNMKAITNSLKAKKVEEIIEDSYYSTTMYTPLISQKIQYQNKTINLQIASRYSEYDDRTYLWIATPLITYTY